MTSNNDVYPQKEITFTDIDSDDEDMLINASQSKCLDLCSEQHSPFIKSCKNISFRSL